MSEAYDAPLRDRFAAWLANQILTRVATVGYIAFLHVTYRLGKEELACKLSEEEIKA